MGKECVIHICSSSSPCSVGPNPDIASSRVLIRPLTRCKLRTFQRLNDRSAQGESHAQFSRWNDPGDEATCSPYTFTVCMMGLNKPHNKPQVIELLNNFPMHMLIRVSF